MLLVQLVAENGLVSVAAPEVDWRSADEADARYLLVWHLDQEVGTFTLWKKTQKDLSWHRYLPANPLALARW